MAKVARRANASTSCWVAPMIGAALILGLVTPPALTRLPPPVAVPVAPAAAAEETQINRWAKELGHDRFRVREVASRNLIKVGNKAVGALIQAAHGDNLEAALRAVGVLHQLAKQAAVETPNEAATAALVKVAASAPPAAAYRAKAVLIDIQERFVRHIEQLGGTIDRNAGRVSGVNLNRVKALDKALPLLRNFPALELVSLNNPRMNDVLMPHLKGLPRLKNLVLCNSCIGDDGLKYLKTLPNLLHVQPGMTRITDAGLVHLKELKQMEYVGLRGNQVTDAGLVQLRGLTKLTGLYLGETKVTDAGLVHLRGMTQMTWLRLDHTRVTDAGLEHLKGMTKLQQLAAEGSLITGMGVARLRQVIPKVQVSIEAGK